MNLLDLQRRMAEDVRRPLTTGFGMRKLAEDGTPTADIASGYIKPNAMLTSFERLEIYNRQYWFRAIEAVSEDYPALNALLGPKRFDALIVAYLRENPSVSFTLRNLGARLPGWLAAHPEFTGARHDLAVDVARLEWAYIEAFDSASLPPLSAAEYVELLPDSVLPLQPHVQLLELRYPVDELVLAVRRGKPEADIASNAVSERKRSQQMRIPRLRRAATYLVVHRFDYSVYYRRIDREGYLLLEALRHGRSIEEAVGCASCGVKLPPRVFADKIREYFAHASELGWITAKRAS
jgi:hypothetical protein